MPSKLDPDARTGDKLLRLFRKLLFDNRRHFQQDLARELNCSPQTVIRLMEQIESAVGIALEMGTEQRRRWYRLNPGEKGHLGLDFEELRFLTLCRRMAGGILPEQTLQRVDRTIQRLAMHMADPHFQDQDDFAFYIKGASITHPLRTPSSASSRPPAARPSAGSATKPWARRSRESTASSPYAWPP